MKEISPFVRNDIQWYEVRRGGWLAALPPTNLPLHQKMKMTVIMSEAKDLKYFTGH
jgi:hypothetical protein